MTLKDLHLSQCNNKAEINEIEIIFNTKYLIKIEGAIKFQRKQYLLKFKTITANFIEDRLKLNQSFQQVKRKVRAFSQKPQGKGILVPYSIL